MFLNFKKFSYPNYDVGYGGNLINKNFKGIDLFRFSYFHKSIVWDLRKKLPLKANCADFIYSSHAIEHLAMKDSRRLLKDIFLTLKKGGVLRIVCPDARKFIDFYLNNGGQQFKNGVSALMFLAQESDHKSIWDAASLIQTLVEIGFTDVSEVNYGQTKHKFPISEEKISYKWQSVYIEAVK